MTKKFFLLLSVFFLHVGFSFSQEATVRGLIKGSDGKPLVAVNVAVKNFSGGTATDEQGRFSISVPAGKEVVLAFSYIGYQQLEQKVFLQSGEVFEFNPSMQSKSKDLTEVEISAEQDRGATMTKINPKIISYLPSASGNVEAILFSQPGVTSNNELSSQYSVRGGNFDENLVYVNDVQIYRPFLVRSGQQEGLSFTNSDLVESISFSAGGFESRYGDKMSSVLDITYKEPTKFAGSVMGSFLGGSVHIEDASKNHRFTQLHGIRYRTNQYILGSLDTKGSYRPAFTDYQTYLTYDLSDKVEIAFLGNISRNKYQFIPETRESDFGTINQALRLTVYFEGNEINEYTTYLGAFTTNVQASKTLNLKFIASAFKTEESETFDIEGAYSLDELERDFSKDNFGDVAFNRGVGVFLNHARNYLDAYVVNANHLGKKTFKSSSLEWGLTYQFEQIYDELSEWNMIDSAGYSLPHSPDLVNYYDRSQRPDQFVNLAAVYRASNELASNRTYGFLQYNNFLSLRDTSTMKSTLGVRYNYWDYNKQFLLSPRFTLCYIPKWKRDFTFKAAAGVYQQPAFYREMRNLYGQLNPNIKAQVSYHFVLGSEYNFELWKRPFVLTNELYYKWMDNLVPYEIDNVRIRYYATNNAKGYAYGIDSKIHGEFVPGAESWFSLSVMKVQEDIKNDFYYDYFNATGEKIIFGYSEDQVAVDSTRYEPGYIPRPTDQRVNFGIMFQDYIPKLPTYKMNLNLLFGSGLPFGPPTYERYKDTLRIPPYRRVDIGFSKALLTEDQTLADKNPFKHFKSIWISAEVFNLLQINNTISYIWITDVTNNKFAIPNYLTSRRLNLKLIMKF